MKRFLYTIHLSLTVVYAFAQDLPIAAQKFSNNAFYNPAVVGLNGNLGDFAFQRRWHNLDNNFSIAYASGHFVFNEYGIATGISAYMESTGLFKKTELAASLAYHTQISNTSLLSYGLKASYMQNSFDNSSVEVRSQNDFLINNFGNQNNFDFSFGLNYSSEYFDAGLSSNNIVSLLRGFNNNENNLNYTFPSFFTAHTIVRSAKETDENNHLFEGRLNYRRTINNLNIVDAGIYYTYAKQITFGASYRNNNAFYLLAGYTLTSKSEMQITLGYSHEIFAGNNIYKNLPSEEIILRYVHDRSSGIGNSINKSSNGPRRNPHKNRYKGRTPKKPWKGDMRIKGSNKKRKRTRH